MNDQTQIANRPAKAAAPAAPRPPIKSGGALAAMVPQDMDQAFRLASALSQSGDMVPKHFQGKPEMTMAAIMRGMEVGLAPMQALSQIAVIKGRASIWGDALPALMQRAGHHVDVRIEGEGDKAVAIATLTRGDTGKTIERRFSMIDAKRAGLAGKEGPWQQYPLRMLSHRARSWAIRDGAADALMGLEVAEEVQDYGPATARDVTPSEAPRGGVSFDAPAPTSPPATASAEPDDRILDGEIVDGNADDLPSPEDLARAEAEAREEIARRDAEAEGEG